jgi:hypothetical protein
MPLPNAFIAEIVNVSGCQPRKRYRAGEPDWTRLPATYRTRCPNRSLNDDDIDIEFLHHGTRDLPQPRPAEPVCLHTLYMDARNYQFTIEPLDNTDQH